MWSKGLASLKQHLKLPIIQVRAHDSRSIALQNLGALLWSPPTILTSFIVIKLLKRISELFATFHNMKEVYPLVAEHSSQCRIWFNLPKKILGKPLYKMYVLSFCAFTKTQSWCRLRDGQLIKNVNSTLIKAAISL